MSLPIKNVNKNEINTSLLELRRRADEALANQSALYIVCTSNLPFMQQAFRRVENYLYLINYYESILSHTDAIEEQRERLENRLRETQTKLTQAQNELAALRQRYKELGTEIDNLKRELNQLQNDYDSWYKNTYTPAIADCNTRKSQKQTELTAKEQEVSAKRAEIQRMKEDLANVEEWVTYVHRVYSAMQTQNGSSFFPVTDDGVTHRYLYGVGSVNGIRYVVEESFASQFFGYSVIRLQLKRIDSGSLNEVLYTTSYHQLSGNQSVSNSNFNTAWAGIMDYFSEYVVDYYDELQENGEEDISNAYEELYDLEDEAEEIQGDIDDIDDEIADWNELNEEKLQEIADKQNDIETKTAERTSVQGKISSTLNEISDLSKEETEDQAALDDFNERYPK